MSDPRVLFIDQTGALGGAELCLLDAVELRCKSGGNRDHVLLLSEGPFLERLHGVGVSAEVLSLSVDVKKRAGVVDQLVAGPRVLRLAMQIAARARQYDLIYANTLKAAIVGAVAAQISRRPFIWHLHDLLNAEHFSSANRRVVIAATNFSAQRVIANSGATAEAYRRAGGRVPVTVVHNGIDPVPFESITETETVEVRKTLAIPDGSTLVGMFGRLTEWKGQHLLLEALATKELKSVHAIMVGDALFTEEDRNYATRLKKQSMADSLKGRIHWLGHRNEIPLLMRACNMVVHCSTQPEPFGRVLVEGMLAKRPVIASAAGGAVEIIDDGRTGLLTQLGCSQSLRKAIKRLVNHPDEANRLAMAGHVEARQRFDLNDRVADLNRVIEDVAARKAVQR